MSGIQFGPNGCKFKVGGGPCREKETLQIIQQFKQLYEAKLREIEREDGGGDNLEAKVCLQRDWIRDLTEQNEMLVRAVEELEREATDRVTMLEEKLKNTARSGSEVMQKYQDFNFSINLDEASQKWVYLQNDVRNLLEFIRRVRDEDSWSIDGLQFYSVSCKDLYGNPIPCKCGGDNYEEENVQENCEEQAAIEMKEKNGKLKELEDQLKQMTSQMQAKETELAKVTQSMMDMRNALTIEVADKHDIILSLRRDVQQLEEQCRQSNKQTQFKDDIIKELRKEIKQLKAEESEERLCSITSKHSNLQLEVYDLRSDLEDLKVEVTNLQSSSAITCDKSNLESSLGCTCDKSKRASDLAPYTYISLEMEKEMELHGTSLPCHNIHNDYAECQKLFSTSNEKDPIIGSKCDTSPNCVKFKTHYDMELRSADLPSKCFNPQCSKLNEFELKDTSLKVLNEFQKLQELNNDRVMELRGANLPPKCFNPQCPKLKKRNELENASLRHQSYEVLDEFQKLQELSNDRVSREDELDISDYKDLAQKECRLFYMLAEEINKLLRDTYEKDKQILEQKEVIEQLTRKICLFHNKLIELQTISSEYRGSIADEDNANLLARLKKAEEENKTLKDSTLGANQELDKLYQQANGYVVERDDYKKKYNDSLSAIETLTKEADAAKDAFAKAKNQNADALKNMKESNQKNLAELERVRRDSEAMSQAQNATIEALQQALTEKAQKQGIDESASAASWETASTTKGEVSENIDASVQGLSGTGLSASAAGGTVSRGAGRSAGVDSGTSALADGEMDSESTVSGTVSRGVGRSGGVDVVSQAEGGTDAVDPSEILQALRRGSVGELSRMLQKLAEERDIERAKHNQEVANLKATIDEVEKSLGGGQLEISGLQTQVDLFKNSINVLEAGQEKARIEISQQQLTISNLQEALIISKHQLEELQQKASSEVSLGWAARWFGSSSSDPKPAGNNKSVHDI